MDEERLRDLHEHLAATGERPVERTASRWLGEAEAIAGDVARGGLDGETRRRRLRKVAELLGHVDGTGDEEADEHVEAACEMLDELLGDA